MRATGGNAGHAWVAALAAAFGPFAWQAIAAEAGGAPAVVLAAEGTPAAGGAAVRLQPAESCVYVTELHCSGCAKKLTRKIYALPGVAKVRADVKANAAVATPQAGKRLAAKDLWSAAKAAGFEPVRLVGPDGVYTVDDATGEMTKTAARPGASPRG